MDERSRVLMNRHYSTLLSRHGRTLGALEYRSKSQQAARFAMLASIEPIPADSSVLDVGCGLGHLCDFLRLRGWRGAYTGIDINARMIEACRSRLPDGTFHNIDILKQSFDRRFDYVFCGAAIQHRPKYGSDRKYFRQMIRKMFGLARRGLAFDIFSSRVDYRDEGKLYVDPCEVLNFCYELTPRVAVRNDYRPYEIVVYLYRQTARNRFNIFRGWKESAVRVLNSASK